MLIKRYVNKKTGICLLGLAALLAAVRPLMAADALEPKFVDWVEKDEANRVGVTLCLLQDDPLEDVVTFAVPFQLTGEDVQDAVFEFDGKLKSNKEVPVTEYYFDPDTDILTVYVSGREPVLTKSSSAPLNLGIITVTSEKNVDISLAEEGCETVNRFHEKGKVSVLGETGAYLMELEVKEPDTPPASEDTTEETTGSDTTGGEPGGETTGSDTTSGEPGDETTGGGTTLPADPSGTDESASSEASSKDQASSERQQDIGFNNSSETKGTWAKADNVWSFKKDDGTYAKGEWILNQGVWYHFDASGQMQTGWIKDQDVWYYCSPSGARKSGWIWDRDRWYYCGPRGNMKTGWVEDKSYWYYMDPSGAMKTGWTDINGKWYYFDENGHMAVDTTTPDGYRVDRNGVRM